MKSCIIQKNKNNTCFDQMINLILVLLRSSILQYSDKFV